ncbi:MAG: 16S rRNA (adenine(1518)-N(6)/adenine(1519)-N(6))-dimethyltransferase RsmA [Acidiferrobacterales bacterium]
MNHRPRKRFGQHFLHDKHVIERIVQAINPQTTDTLVEIGPGEGVLTHQLAPLCKQFHALEIDRDLAGNLLKYYEQDSHVQIHVGDALKVDICSLSPPGTKVRLVGNLPYNVSTPLLFHFMRHIDCIHDMHFMLQKEVVDRIAAAPGSKSYGRLSIMMQMLCEAESLFDIGPGAFRPPPKVWSAVVRLLPRQKPLIDRNKIPVLEQFGQRLFSQRRKTLRKILQGSITVEALESLGIDSSRRPETLTLEEIVALLDLLPGADQ